MGFVDKFLNILGKIKYRMMRMIGKENKIDEEWETISDKLLDLIERDPSKVEKKFKNLKKKANINELEKEPEKIKERKIYSYMGGATLFLFICSFIVRAKSTQILFSRWIPQIFPILLFFVLGCIPYI
ncbi:MAG: hypothetical protein KAV80_05125, partial [Methanomicrobia archaeon]|nr:hypothetical protein [Methanomicrobia archaeon]